MICQKRLCLVVVALGSLGACSSDLTSEGEGSVAFTTWGEEYIEQELPVDPGDGSGFVDGWSVKFEKFLVNIQNITIADSTGKTAAHWPASKLFDQHVAGVKPVVTFDRVEARAWDQVSFEIAPVSAASELSPEVSAADRDMMVANNFSVYVLGTASSGSTQKTFNWGFDTATRYANCNSEQNGKTEFGLVVGSNSKSTIELTIHGDHFFYDRLQASANPAQATSLRFDAIAAADADADGTVTLVELDATPLDVTRYDPSGLGASTLGDFVRSLVRTIGHYRGEGECSVSRISAAP